MGNQGTMLWKEGYAYYITIYNNIYV